ncbi:MAG: hypothetical protein IT379_21555 [Deltaproteobacteria bacterium]|nr:hypothetical protein [Deltaproteobacteria bacterium]
MGLKLNVAIILSAMGIWASLLAFEPEPAMANDPERQRLARLEDRFAREPRSLDAARALAHGYLQMDEPSLALAAIRSADPRVLRDPMMLHQLSRAYEGVGRMEDAVATAGQALARCDSAMGFAEALDGSVDFGCNPRVHAMLAMHLDAVERLERWGVTDPRAEPVRTRLAYDLAVRPARLASAR